MSKRPSKPFAVQYYQCRHGQGNKGSSSHTVHISQWHDERLRTETIYNDKLCVWAKENGFRTDIEKVVHIVCLEDDTLKVGNSLSRYLGVHCR